MCVRVAHPVTLHRIETNPHWLKFAKFAIVMPTRNQKDAMNIKLILLPVLIFACSPIAFAQRDNAESTIKTLRGIRSVEFRNFTYRTTLGDPAKTQTIRLHNGKYEDGGKYEAGGLLYELYGKPAY